jgi:hypothetical protein
MNQKGRLFTFGCSRTAYRWPTWADIIGCQWEYFENWGKNGAGNTYIFDSVIECDAQNQLTENDTVMIMWTGIARIDSYQINEWSHTINIFARDDSTKPYSCPDGYEILSYPLFVALEQYLKSKNINYIFMSHVPYDTESNAGRLYQNTIQKIKLIKYDLAAAKIKLLANVEQVESLYKRLAGPDWPGLDSILENCYTTVSTEIDQEVQDFIQLIKDDPYFSLKSRDIVDTHPLPLGHLKAEKQIVPDLELSDSTLQWVSNINEKILKGKYYHYDKHYPTSRL